MFFKVIIITTVMLVSSLELHASDSEPQNNKLMARPKVIFIDVNETLLDLSKVGDSVATALGGRDELVPYWFTTMLHYSLVGNSTDQYQSFVSIGIASLEMVAAEQGIPLSHEEARKAVLTPFRALEPHKDVIEGLIRLRKLGYKLITLTNSSDAGIAAQLKNSGLGPYVDGSLTVESLQVFKPDLEVYQWAQAQMGVAPENAMLIAAHAWDIAGAKNAGWKTGFIQRPGKALFPLTADPDVIGHDLLELIDQLESKTK